MAANCKAGVHTFPARCVTNVQAMVSLLRDEIWIVRRKQLNDDHNAHVYQSISVDGCVLTRHQRSYPEGLRDLVNSGATTVDINHDGSLFVTSLIPQFSSFLDFVTCLWPNALSRRAPILN